MSFELLIFFPFYFLVLVREAGRGLKLLKCYNSVI